MFKVVVDEEGMSFEKEMGHKLKIKELCFIAIWNSQVCYILFEIRRTDCKDIGRVEFVIMLITNVLK